MTSIQQKFDVAFEYNISFSTDLFSTSNNTLIDLISNENKECKKVAFVIDDGVVSCHPKLVTKIDLYCINYLDKMIKPQRPLILKGGEQCKNSMDCVTKVLKLIEEAKIDRHSYLIVIGGGAILDMAGFAAAIAHRGVRLIRIPTTVLSQNDSGVGVKNSINFFGKKNFLGTFSPPFAVLNDINFLYSLTDRDWRSGIAEAIKVALIKDKYFFNWVENNVGLLNARNMEAMEELIRQCAILHTSHIASGGDPFEKGSSRPLDFGHWSAHKLEQLTEYELRHGEAVAIGIAIDVKYSHLVGFIDESTTKRVLNVLKSLGFDLYHPVLEQNGEHKEFEPEIISGLEEFREHLGGDLTIMLLKEIGCGIEVNDMHYALILEAIQYLKHYKTNSILQLSC